MGHGKRLRKEQKTRKAAARAKQAKKQAPSSTPASQAKARQARLAKESAPAAPTAPTPTVPQTAFDKAQAEARAGLAPATPAELAGQPQKLVAPQRPISTVRAATGKETFAATPLGEFVSGFTSGFTPDPAGRQLQTLPPANIVGKLIGMASTLSAISSLGASAQAIQQSLQRTLTNQGTLRALATLEKTNLPGQAKDLIRVQQKYGHLFPFNKVSAGITLEVAKGIAKAGGEAAVVGRLTGLTARGTKLVQGAVPVIIMNSKSKTLLNKMLIASGFTMGALMIIQKGHESITFAFFQIAEALDKLGYARSRAEEQGLTELVADLDEFSDEIINPEGWDKIISLLPWLSARRGTLKNIAAAKLANVVYKAIDEDKRIQRETGESEDDKWARINQKEQDLYLETTELSLQLKKQYDDNERQAREDQRNKDAIFWAAEKAKERELEKADRKAIADFWILYRKTLLRLTTDNRPSNLNFGLL